MEKHLLEEKINEILEKNHIVVTAMNLFQENTRTTDYLIDNKYIFRISKNNLSEIEKILKINGALYIQKIYFFGKFKIQETNYSYALIDFVDGQELYDAIPKLTVEQQRMIGENISDFMESLHENKGDAYDIGHYVPTIPKWKGTWKDGHIEYVNLLRESLANLDFKDESHEIIKAAFSYIDKNIEALKYQAGPVVLHNDFHPKNIIIDDNGIAGVIDWECSQYGEADFELSHLFHWCIFPPDKDHGFPELLATVYKIYVAKNNVPYLSDRLTIYQLEHELNQLYWHNGSDIDIRTKRIKSWLDGAIPDFIKSIK